MSAARQEGLRKCFAAPTLGFEASLSSTQKSILKRYKAHPRVKRLLAKGKAVAVDLHQSPESQATISSLAPRLTRNGLVWLIQQERPLLPKELLLSMGHRVFETLSPTTESSEPERVVSLPYCPVLFKGLQQSRIKSMAGNGMNCPLMCSLITYLLFFLEPADATAQR